MRASTIVAQQKEPLTDPCRKKASENTLIFKKRRVLAFVVNFKLKLYNEKMTLIDLILFFRQGGTLDAFRKQQSLDRGAEAIEIFSRDIEDPKAELGFFSIEETRGRTEFVLNDIKYHNLFDLFYFLGAIDEEKNNQKLSHSYLAE